MTVTSPKMIDPAFVSRLRTRNATTGEFERDEVLEHMEQAMATRKAAADAIESVATALADDPTQPDAAKAVQVRKVALAQGEKAAQRLDAAKAAAAKAITILERELTPDPADEIGEKLAPTILARLASLSDDARQKVMSQAIDGNDTATLSAVFLSPAWLSGHGAAELEIRREAWRMRWCPEQHARAARIRKAIDALERGGKSLVAFIRHHADSPAAILAEKAAARSAAAIAAASKEAV